MEMKSQKILCENNFTDAGGMVGKTELFTLNMFIVIVLGIGFIITRNFFKAIK